MKKLIIGGLFGIFMGVVIIFLSQNLHLFKDFERASLNFRFVFGGGAKEAAFDDVVIVDIDNESIRSLGRWQSWPRRYYAEVIDYIREGGAKAIGSDVAFVDYSNPKDDEAIIEVSKKTQNFVNSFFFPFTAEVKGTPSIENMQRLTLPQPKGIAFVGKYKNITPPIKEIQKVSGGIGYFNRYPDDDGNTRSLPLVTPYQNRLYLSLSLAVVCKALGIDINDIRFGEKYLYLSHKKRIPVEKGVKMWIKYIGGAKSFRFIPFTTVLGRKVPREYFKDKIVIIGGSAEGLFDITTNPFSEVYPGVEIHANIIHNILTNNFMTKVSERTIWIIILFLGTIIGLFSSVLSLKKGIFAMIGLLFGYLAASVIIFETKGLWLEMVSPSFSMGLSFLSVWLWRFQTEEREKKKVRGMFSRYVSKDVVEMLVSNPDAFSLGGKRLELSVLFSDICGFTTLSEKLQAEEIVSLLNEYFTAMNQVIFKHKGTLDKYIGDAIMVFYGAPLYPEDHAKRAVLTALDMIRELNRLKKEWKARGKEELDIGIGINTGEMVVGNIGSDIQTNYTVIGDEVNLASRLEGMTRRYDAQIIISKATYEKIKDEILSREVDLIVVKGKTRPVMIYEPIGLINEVGEEKKKQLEVFQNGLLLYKEKKWKEAANVFSTIMEDGISRMYFMRCQDYIASPPPPDWDGVYVYKTK
ncbi:MAG: adenylate/guanylate cyclase domain-containing protein [bacterium]